LPRARRLAATSSLLLFDLDGFKQINDTLGHAAGDRALVDFAHALLTTFREADVIARLGGDEFCVLASGSAASMSAPLVWLAEHLSGRADRPYRLRFSVGVADDAGEAHTLDELLRSADDAMYASKRVRRAPPERAPAGARAL
jgi:diguanylate cyclase (GGDEF)-like protein